jgi:hypothetical protein
VLCGKSERRPEAIVARLSDGAEEAVTGVVHFLTAVRHEQPRVNRLRNRKAKLNLATGPDDSAEVGDVEARPAVICGETARDARLSDVRVAVSQVEIVDVSTELPLQLRAFAAAEQVGLIEADESAEAGSLPHRGAEVDVARSLLFHVEDDVDVALIAARPRFRRRHRRLEEIEVADVLIAANQIVAIEDLTGREDDLLANT